MAGRPKRRARLAKMVAGHKASVHKGKRRCKKCGKRHSISVHWSHEHGSHKGSHGETAWYGRKPRPQGKRKIRKPAKKRKGARRRTATTFGPIKVTRAKRLPRRTAAQMLAMGRAAAAKSAPKKRRAKGGRKKPRTAAQKAATARMLAGLARKRAGKAGRKFMAVKPSYHAPGHIPMHHVRGHLAKKPKGRGKHRVKAHMAAEPGFGGMTLSAADRAHNRRLARKFNRKK